MLSRIGLSSARERARASALHGYQSTGFEACWSKYGLVSLAKRFRTESEGLIGVPLMYAEGSPVDCATR